jgi:hypothetical protein
MERPKGATLLRTLSGKSPMRFGKYYDSTVNQVIGLGLDGVNYLVWVYFKCDMISFTNEVLNDLMITDELRIDKPSKSPIGITKWKDKLTDDQRLKLWHGRNRQRSFNERNNNRIDRNINTSETFRAKNHGNKKS